MRTEEIKALLRARFCQPTHVILFEVSDATGFNGSGWADAISMSLWPSHGLNLEGYEIKVSRNDWQKELANPAKAEKFAARCDKWWLVTAENVIKDEREIPEKWGWMVATEKGLRINRPAAKNNQPVAVDRIFLAALLRGAGKFDQAQIEAICQIRLTELRQNDERDIEYKIRQAAGRKSDDTQIMDLVRKGLGQDCNFVTIQSMTDSIIAVYKSGIAETWRGLKTVVNLLEDTSIKLRQSNIELNLPKIEKKKKPQK